MGAITKIGGAIGGAIGTISPVGGLVGAAVGAAGGSAAQHNIDIKKRNAEAAAAAQARRDRLKALREGIEGSDIITDRTRGELTEQADRIAANIDVPDPELGGGDVDKLLTEVEGIFSEATGGKGKFGRRQALDQRFKLAQASPGLRRQTVGKGGSLLFSGNEGGTLLG